MLCRIAVGGFALLATSVVSASAQTCLFPGACQETRSSAEKVKPNARRYANLRQNVKTNLSLQKEPTRIERGKLLDDEKEEPLIKEFRQGQQKDNRRGTPTDQAARDALFDEFLRWWRVHQVTGN
jgi:hypothetical protein